MSKRRPIDVDDEDVPPIKNTKTAMPQKHAISEDLDFTAPMQPPLRRPVARTLDFNATPSFIPEQDRSQLWDREDAVNSQALQSIPVNGTTYGIATPSRPRFRNLQSSSPSNALSEQLRTNETSYHRSPLPTSTPARSSRAAQPSNPRTPITRGRKSPLSLESLKKVRYASPYKVVREGDGVDIDVISRVSEAFSYSDVSPSATVAIGVAYSKAFTLGAIKMPSDVGEHKDATPKHLRHALDYIIKKKRAAREEKKEAAADDTMNHELQDERQRNIALLDGLETITRKTLNAAIANVAAIKADAEKAG